MLGADQQYLDLLENILCNGSRRMDRTGVGTFSIFGTMQRFDLARGLPLLTTKRIPWKSAIRELLWFLSGETNIRPLLQQGVRIWTAWPIAAYSKSTGTEISQAEFERRVLDDDAFAQRWGNLGPVYGKQWRNWVGPDGRRHDQIATLIDTLKRNPSSRRMLFHAWNVGELDDMALPPCHLLYQYHVSEDLRLNCLLFQRSADVFLGLPWNLAEAAVLQHMMAQQAGLALGELVWVGGDVHLYCNHVQQARQQLKRSPRGQPQLSILRKPDSIDDYRIEDFEVTDYDPHPAIAAEVAV